MQSLPSYSITHLIVNYLIKFEVAMDKINSTPLPKDNLKELLAQTETIEIQQLSELIGNPIQEYKAEQIQKGHVIPTSNSPLLIFSNYRSALEFSRNYKSLNNIKPSSNLLMHINKITFKKIVDQWDTGKIRSFSDKPIELYDTWYKYRENYPNINQSDYFDSLLNWVDQTTSIHVLIRFGILLYELIDKAPLYAGNQVSAIALIQALSKDYAVNPHMLVSFTRAINYIAPDLESAFKQSRKNQDLTTFLEAFTYTTSLEMLNLEQKYLKTFDVKIKQGGKLRDKFNTRQIKLLEHLENIKKVSREDYAKLVGVSFMTAYRDIKHLLSEGYLEKGGTGRGTYYSLKDSEKKNAKEKVPLIFKDRT